MRYALLAISARLPAAAGCGGETTLAHGQPPARLPRRRRGVRPVLEDSNWTGCDQWPYEGERARSVDLYVEHFCDEEEYEDDDDF
jgi:hypothetical protein